MTEWIGICVAEQCIVLLMEQGRITKFKFIIVKNSFTTLRTKFNMIRTNQDSY